MNDAQKHRRMKELIADRTLEVLHMSIDPETNFISINHDLLDQVIEGLTPSNNN